MKQLTREPGLKGRGLAKAGLVVGYVGLVLCLIVAVALLAFGFSLAKLHAK